MLLAFDTSGLSCSVALRDGDQLWTDLYVGEPQHSRQLLPMLDQLLIQAGRRMGDVTALAYGRGPGSFTGIRVAAGLAQGLGYSLNCPVLAISTLGALARQAWRRHGAQQVLAAIDARLGELYWGGFQANGEGRLTDLAAERVAQPDSVAAAPTQDWFGIGSGWKIAEVKLRDNVRGRVLGTDADAVPLAEDIAALALIELAASGEKTWPAESAQPIYLRDRVAHGS